MPMNQDPLFRLQLWRALSEALERIASTVLAACVVGAVIGPAGSALSGAVAGTLALVIALLSCYGKVRLDLQIADTAKEADGQ
tara:strand:+ start:163 stop:411 length:249 start_codon:yes stop_codon:yes gene_type:complete